jgi:excisionase family DNA binding protein
MRKRRASARRVKMHLNYTPEEVANLTEAHKNTVLRWIASRQLPAMTDMRPYLVLGRDLITFLSRASAGSAKLKVGECYCVRCKTPQVPALNMADFRPVNERWGNLRGICPTCETMMHRRVPCARLKEITGPLEVRLLEALPRLTPCLSPSTNVDSEDTRHDHGKALPCK